METHTQEPINNVSDLACILKSQEIQEHGGELALGSPKGGKRGWEEMVAGVAQVLGVTQGCPRTGRHSSHSNCMCKLSSPCGVWCLSLGGSCRKVWGSGWC